MYIVHGSVQGGSADWYAFETADVYTQGKPLSEVCSECLVSFEITPVNQLEWSVGYIGNEAETVYWTGSIARDSYGWYVPIGVQSPPSRPSRASNSKSFDYSISITYRGEMKRFTGELNSNVGIDCQMDTWSSC
jgi:hypothetical protein